MTATNRSQHTQHAKSCDESSPHTVYTPATPDDLKHFYEVYLAPPLRAFAMLLGPVDKAPSSQQGILGVLAHALAVQADQTFCLAPALPAAPAPCTCGGTLSGASEDAMRWFVRPLQGSLSLLRAEDGLRCPVHAVRARLAGALAAQIDQELARPPAVQAQPHQ